MSDTPSIKGFFGVYRWLSNFEGELNGRTVEHYYQAAKCIDPKEKEFILSQPKANLARREGQKVKCRPDWHYYKFKVMFKLLLWKYKHRKYKDALLSTKDAYLEESNTWHDNAFGNCICEKCGGKGKNVLGKMEMLIRRMWQDEESKSS